jgi:hypothetical protein
MSDDGSIDRRSRIELERAVLRLLCQSGGGPSLRNRAREILSGYQWSDDAHQATFEILVSFPTAGQEVLREQLPARLTRRGFPDFDFAGLFNAQAPSSADAEVLMLDLARHQ